MLDPLGGEKGGRTEGLSILRLPRAGHWAWCPWQTSPSNPTTTSLSRCFYPFNKGGNASPKGSIRRGGRQRSAKYFLRASLWYALGYFLPTIGRRYYFPAFNTKKLMLTGLPQPPSLSPDEGTVTIRVRPAPLTGRSLSGGSAKHFASTGSLI